MERTGSVPAVSVCMPVFNGARFLSRAFASLSEQRFQDFEVVVVDDGSTDGTTEEARRLLAHHGLNGRVIRTENRGNARARDLSCESAQAELIATLDCDDAWDPRYLQEMLAVFRSRADIDLVYSDLLELFPDGRKILKSDVATWVDTSQPDFDGNTHVFHRGAFFKMLLRGQVLFPSCTIYRKSLYREVGGYAAKLPELPTSLDWYFGLRAARAGTVAFLKRPLLQKYARSDSVSNTSTLRTSSSSVRILETLLRDPTLRPEERRSACWRGALISHHCAYESWATERNQIEAMKWVVRALRFEWSWNATKLGAKILIPRILIENLRPSSRGVVSQHSPRHVEPSGSQV